MFRGRFSQFLKPAMLTFACLALAAASSEADDWSGVLEKIRTKYAQYEKKINDMKSHQQIIINTEGHEITTESTLYKKKNKFRMENSVMVEDMPKEMGPMVTIVIFDGQDTWVISSMMGKQKLSGEDENQYKTMTDWWNFLSENAEITGTEKVGDRDCYIIKMKETDSSPYSMLWLDKKDLILVKARSEISGGEKVEMNFSDFRKIDGDMLVPYQTEMFTGGKLMSTVKVLSVEVNQDLSDDLFDVQKADVKGPNMQDMMKMMQKRGKG